MKHVLVKGSMRCGLALRALSLTPPPPPLPCSIKCKPSHAPPLSAPSTCLGSQGSCAPRGVCSHAAVAPPGLTHTGTLITVASGSPSPEDKKTFFHYRTWLCVTFCSEDIVILRWTIRGTCEKKIHPFLCCYKKQFFRTLTQQFISYYEPNSDFFLQVSLIVSRNESEAFFYVRLSTSHCVRCCQKRRLMSVNVSRFFFYVCIVHSLTCFHVT